MRLVQICGKWPCHDVTTAPQVGTPRQDTLNLPARWRCKFTLNLTRVLSMTTVRFNFAFFWNYTKPVTINGINSTVPLTYTQTRGSSNRIFVALLPRQHCKKILVRCWAKPCCLCYGQGWLCKSSWHFQKRSICVGRDTQPRLCLRSRFAATIPRVLTARMKRHGRWKLSLSHLQGRWGWHAVMGSVV